MASCNPDNYRIAVLTDHGEKENVVKAWIPVVDYLSVQIPNSTFEVVPLYYDEFSPVVSNNSVDFFYSNPMLYVEMARLHGAGRIATFQPTWNNSTYAGMGGVIFTKNERDDINSLQDLKGRSFIAVNEHSLGGYLAANGEFHQNDISSYDFSKLTFANSQEDVVFSVIEGKADAGTVRSGVLESMISDGSMDADEIKILNMKEYNDYPFAVSTELYPDWVFAKTKNTPDDISKEITIALLSMPSNSEAAISIGASGWTVPADYSPVDRLMRELSYGMYVGHDKISFKEACSQHWYVLVFFILIVALFEVHSHWMLDRKKKSQLEASNRLKDLFTDIMRHDLMNL
ncbi:MAG: phosphate/phosphite/phosphonate ABC transporter substrate-binding protein [Methanolobus sp.]